MTDWLPWGWVLMVGSFTTQALMLRALKASGVKASELRTVKLALALTAILSFAVYALYVFYGERWIWY